jgi:hypothetical protein
MTPLQKLIILSLGIAISSCNQNESRNSNTVDTVSQKTTSTARQKTKKTLNLTDTLSKLFQQALTADTIEFDSREPFLYFKSGHVISRTEKNAITIKCPNGTYLLELYSCQGKKWQVTDSIALLDDDMYIREFDATYADFNFDHQIDIYIQATLSNGYPLSRGFLIIVDPATKKLNYHKEARNLANMKPFSRTRTVMSEEWLDFEDTSADQKISILTNKWENGKLRTIKKKEILEHL